MLAAALALALICCGAAAEEAGGADLNADYVPQRYKNTNNYTGLTKMKYEKDGVKYKGYYKDGKLQELEVEIEYDEDDIEYEVRYDPQGAVIRAEYETEDGQITYDGTAWHDEDGNEVEGPDIGFMKEYYNKYRMEPEYYPNNTMSLIGLPLRELKPGLTTRWYHVLPVDLTEEGSFRYQMAVSNLYCMGCCDLVVQDGKVTVDYLLPKGHIQPEAQYLAWFTDLDDITTEYLENPKSLYRFGEPVDIQQDLKGQKIALLFICNRVIYRLPYSGNRFPAKFAPASDKVRAWQKELKALLDQME